jgi:putative membrane-bound dehydrogenase-like protein
MKRSILPAMTFLVCAVSATAQLPPDKALQSFKVVDDLEISLFASEPMFANPTCIDIDHKGRVWVCESVNYRCTLHRKPLNRPEGDRILILEDTKGDGKADKVTTFYQSPELLAPLGIAVAPNPDGVGVKVYVCQSPDILVFEDKEGKGKADGPPKKLLTGFGGIDHDHGVHGIHFGPDGKLYFSVGDQGVHGLKDPTTGKVWNTNHTDCQAGTMWRCDTDGTHLELLAHNFRNQYEPAVNSFGEMWTSDNDDDGNQQTRICYVMYGGNYGYWPRNKGDHHWHEDQPGVVHKVLRTGFGSPTGMCWYEGTLLLPAFRGQRTEGRRQKSEVRGQQSEPTGYILHTDAGPREVRCFVVKPKGAGYEVDKINLVTSTDTWFRPSDICVAPDGSVMIADWYDPGVGGHGMGDTTRGRIYRLTPKGHKGYKVPALELTSDEGHVAALASPNIATRTLAHQKIKNLLKNQKGGEILEKAMKTGPGDGQLWILARALWLCDEFSTWASGMFLQANDVPTDFRLLALRSFKQTHPDYLDETAKQPINIIYPFLTRDIDRDFKQAAPAVRREWLLTLRDQDPKVFSRMIWELAKDFDGQDYFYLAAINIAVGSDPKRREIILADFEKHFPEWNDKVAKLVWELRPPQVIARLDQKLADPKLTSAQKAQILDILAVSDAETGGAAVLKLLSGNPPGELRDAAIKVLLARLPNKWASLKEAPEITAFVDQLLTEPKTRVTGLQLIAGGQMILSSKRVYQLAADKNESREIRLAAVRVLGELKHVYCARRLVDLFDDADLLRIDNADLQKEVIQALGKHRESIPAVTEGLIRALKDDKARQDIRLEAVTAMAGSRDGAKWLLEAHAKRELPEQLVPDVGRLLRNSPYQDLRNKAMIAFPAPGKIDLKKLPEIAKLVVRKGNADHGKQLFTSNKDLGCVRCHSIRGTGWNVGPDLSMIGKKGSRENLFESIIYPDKAIADQYVQWIVETKQGVVLQGLLVEETADHLILRDALAKDTKIAAKDVEERKKSPKSIMPSDLLAYMTEDDVVDIVEYLATLKTPTLVVDAWHIIGPFDNAGGDAGLDKVYPPEQTIDLSAKYPGKHGPVTWRTVKPNAESYVDLAVFFGGQSTEIVSYLYREIKSPADQEATILIGTDDGCRLRMNGELVLSHNRHEAAAPERDTVKVQLKKGTNTIFLKINNGNNPHGFYFAVQSEQELKLAAMK